MLYGHGDDAFRYKDIRMNFSSNIYSHADMSELKKHLAGTLDVIDSYPEPEPYSLEAMIAEKRGITAECVLAANGATDAIYIIAQAIKDRGCAEVSILNPTFREYEDACLMFGLKTKDAQAPDADGHTPFSEAYWLCNPNNPTGRIYGSQTMLRLAGRTNLLVIDQSYEEHTTQPVLSAKEAIDCGNIIQIHSLTKTYAIPGLRIGYVTASPKIISMLRLFVRPWSVNAIAIEAAKWLLSHEVKAIDDMEAYLKETQRLYGMLTAIEGLEVMPTETNFLLARIACMTAAELKQTLAEKHHILIRDASNFRNLDSHYIRIAAQRQDENDALVTAIRQCIEEKAGSQSQG